MAGQEAPIYRQQLDVPEGPQATVQPIVAPVPDASGVGAAVAGVGEKLQAFAQKKEAADNETLALNARANHAAKLLELEEQYKIDPDWKTAPQRFAAERQRLMGDALEGITDPKVQAQTRLYLSVSGVASQKTVDTAALSRQQKDGSEAAEVATSAVQARAISAGSMQERGALRDAAHGTLSSAVTAGVVSHPAAVARAQIFDQQVATADVGTLIAADPAVAISVLHDPAAFPALDEMQRAGLFNKAYRAEWMNDQAADSAVPAQGVDLVKRGLLTPEWLAAQESAMSTGWRDGFARALSPPEVPHPDPKLRADLIARAVSDPVSAIQTGLAGLGSGALDGKGYADIADLSQRVMADELSRPWVNDGRRELQQRLPAGEDGFRAALRAGTVGEFEGWLSSQQDHPQGPAVQAKATELARDAAIRAAQHDVTTMPMPRFVSSPRDRIDVPAVVEAAGKLRDAMRRGGINEVEFVEQAELLGRWRDALRDLPKGGT